MKPITRKEMLMAKAAGQDVPDITPVTREEYFLSQISGGGGGGVALTNVEVTITDDGARIEKTAGELASLLDGGLVQLVLTGEAEGAEFVTRAIIISHTAYDDGYHEFRTSIDAYIAESASDYPISG